MGDLGDVAHTGSELGLGLLELRIGCGEVIEFLDLYQIQVILLSGRLGGFGEKRT